MQPQAPVSSEFFPADRADSRRPRVLIRAAASGKFAATGFQSRITAAHDRLRSNAAHRRGGTSRSVLLTAPEPTVFDQLAYSQLTTLIRTVLSEEELRLLVQIADGHSYADIASNHNMTVPGLKSKASRVREKVRNSGISAVLRDRLRRR